ncbi:MAG: heme o synthase [Candidatus Bathyarchaeia archaeon]
MKMVRTLLVYMEAAKLKTVLLLVFTGISAAIAGGGISVFVNPTPLLMAVVLSGASGAAGANMLTSYLDRDIDAVMERTRKRPLPSGRLIPAKNALYVGLSLLVISLAASATVNLLCTLLIFIAVVDNVLIYSMFLKRKNPLSVILGGFSGGIPVLVGYAAATGTLPPIAFLVAALVVLWIPTHIWSLAIRYREDYSKVRVPMLPTVVSEKKAVRCIASTSILLVAFSLSLYFAGAFGLLYLAVAATLGAGMITLNTILILRPTKRNAWIVYKYSSPYLGLLFIAMVLDTLL